MRTPSAPTSKGVNSSPVLQGPGSADEDPTGGFTRGGWLVPYVDAGFGAVVDQWFAAGDVVERVLALKEELGDGELQVHGSAQLAATLHEAGLVDEYRLLVFPVCVGEGKRLFQGQGPGMGLEVAESRTTPAGSPT